MRIVSALAIMVAVAMALSFAPIAMASGGSTQGTVTIQGETNPVFPPNITANPNTAPPVIAAPAVPSYSFGTVNITGAAARVQNTNSDGFVRVKDLRGGTAGWSVDVQMSAFINSSSEPINGATVQIITYGTLSTNYPTLNQGTLTITTPDIPREHVPGSAIGALVGGPSDNKPPQLPTGALVVNASGTAPGGNKVRLAKAEQDQALQPSKTMKDREGLGEWWIPTKAVLYIPDTGVLKATGYTAIITWTLNSAP